MPCLTLMWKARGKTGVFPPPFNNRLEKVFEGIKKKDFFHSHLENFFKGKEKEKVFHNSTSAIIINIHLYGCNFFYKGWVSFRAVGWVNFSALTTRPHGNKKK